jgi:hypothetical protein
MNNHERGKEYIVISNNYYKKWKREKKGLTQIKKGLLHFLLFYSFNSLSVMFFFTEDLTINANRCC